MAGRTSAKDNDIEALRTKLVQYVQSQLSPMALKYDYSDVALEANIRWRPVVLILGNYSSGKSTLINELLGAEIQETGQAPTDDSFTVITKADDPSLNHQKPKVIERRDGKVLLYDEQYPFQLLRRHGERFAAHFQLLKVNSPFLDHLAIIDTPGMLDSSSERDRGYQYQEVVGDLAQIADLILVMFDPHKAGTVGETQLSLRNTLPMHTFEDRVVFVLNRIDECQSMADLLRVYGTLCWNLSQMIGRKDIPQIILTYSERLANAQRNKEQEAIQHYLKNQRDELRRRIFAAPQHRLDHLASYIETHGERISHLLEAVSVYGRRRLTYQIKYFATLLLFALAAASVTWLLTLNATLFNQTGSIPASIVGTFVGLVVFFSGYALLRTIFLLSFHWREMKALDGLTELKTQQRRDSWVKVKGRVQEYLQKNKHQLSLNAARRDFSSVNKSYQEASRSARTALSEVNLASNREVVSDKADVLV